MSFSWYKQDADAGGSDYVSVGLWDYKTRPYYAEGGAGNQPGSPAADTGNTSGWGMNNQFRAIADGIINNYNARVSNASSITSLDSRVTTLEAAPSIALWGNITGTLSNQTDLQAALDGKSATGHLHATYLPLTGGTMSGAIDMGSNALSNVTEVGIAGSDFLLGSGTYWMRIRPSAQQIILSHDGGVTFSALLDVNGLTLAIGTTVNEFSIDGTLGDNSDNAVPTEKAVKTYVDTEVAGAGGSTESDPIFEAGNFDYPTSDPAPLEVINSGTITNVRLLGQAFDDTTNETITREFKVPSDIDTSGTVTFRLKGIAETAASANVEFRFAHSVSNSSESADVSYTNEDSGAKAVDTTQDDNTYITWTETVANLGWASRDLCKFQLTRLAAGGNDNLSDDFYVRSLEISIPRA